MDKFFEGCAKIREMNRKAVAEGRFFPFTKHFANGGQVTGSSGLTGEAGPEAIMPLSRSGDGALQPRGVGASIKMSVKRGQKNL